MRLRANKVLYVQNSCGSRFSPFDGKNYFLALWQTGPLSFSKLFADEPVSMLLLKPVSHVALSDFKIVNKFSHALTDMSLRF